MTIGSHHLPAPTDRTDSTRGLLIAALLLAAPQLVFAGFIAVSAWMETWGMTARERADAWTEIAYFIAGIIAVAPVCACLLAAAAWRLRATSAGVGIAVGALVVAGAPALLFASEFVMGR